MVDRIVSQCLREGVVMAVGLTDIKGEGDGAEFCRSDGDHSLLTRIEKIEILCNELVRIYRSPKYCLEYTERYRLGL